MDIAHLLSDKAIEAPSRHPLSLVFLRGFELKGRPFGWFFSLVLCGLLHLKLPTYFAMYASFGAGGLPRFQDFLKPYHS